MQRWKRCAPELEYIGLQSTGYNVVDCAAAKELGITVCNIPAYSTNAVAQLVFAFILSFTNQVAVHTQAVENGEWCRCPDFCFWKTPLMELDGKTLGIFGFGAIGHRVAQIAETFGMQVLVCTPHEKPLDGCTAPDLQMRIRCWQTATSSLATVP